MAINPAGSVSPAIQQLLQPKNEATEAQVNGHDLKNDHDSDDGAAKVSGSAIPSPTVNTQGQQIGLMVNAKA
jgi:hypothetical protein